VLAWARQSERHVGVIGGADWRVCRAVWLLAQDLLNLRAVVDSGTLARLIKDFEDQGGSLRRLVGGQCDRPPSREVADTGRWCAASGSHDMAGLVRAGRRSAAFWSARVLACMSRYDSPSMRITSGGAASGRSTKLCSRMVIAGNELEPTQATLNQAVQTGSASAPQPRTAPPRHPTHPTDPALSGCAKHRWRSTPRCPPPGPLRAPARTGPPESRKASDPGGGCAKPVGPCPAVLRSG